MFPLYVICDADACAARGWRVVDFARACLDGGATLLQLRAKAMSGQEFLETATAIVELARPAGGLVIVNDRADIARIAGAGGVHVGQDDLPPRAVREVVGESAIVGLSTHSAGQMRASVEQPISYLAIGPVFGTSTKVTGYQPLGLETVGEAAAIAAECGLPLVAIGGITLANAAAVIAAGARSVAVISDLLSTGDPAARVRDFMRLLQ